MATITATTTTTTNASKALNGNSFVPGFAAEGTDIKNLISNMMKTCRKISCAANCKHKTAACAAPAQAAGF